MSELGMILSEPSQGRLRVSNLDEVLAEARQGRAFLIVADAQAGTSGLIAAPARSTTPDQVNFMVRHGRGLVCLAITRERARGLKLPLQEERGRPAEAIPFTVSIEAREGVTTGISAQDRAHTIRVAVDGASGPSDLVSPGHIFPVLASDGGVLVRAGFPEAAVDLCTAAGLDPSAAICQVLDEDGEPASTETLARLAQDHDLRILSIADLIPFRQRTETIVERTFERSVPTIHGADFRMVIYRNRLDGAEHIAMIRGEPKPDIPTLVRSHAIDLATDLFGHDNGRRGRIDSAMQVLAASSSPGVAVFLRNPAITWASHYAEGVDEPVLTSREYGIGAQILRDIGVRRMILLTDNPPKASSLEAYDLVVEGVQSF